MEGSLPPGQAQKGLLSPFRSGRGKGRALRVRASILRWVSTAPAGFRRFEHETPLGAFSCTFLNDFLEFFLESISNDGGAHFYTTVVFNAVGLGN